MSTMRRCALLALPLLMLAACGANEEPSAESAATSSSTSASPSPTTPPATTTASPTTPITVEEEAAIAAHALATVFAPNEETLSQQLIKGSPLVEAQRDFRFDEAARTLYVDVASVFDTGGTAVPYSLASSFAPVFWAPATTSSLRPEALPAFSVTVDDTSFVCPGPVMVALADRELSEDMFGEQCAT